MPFKKHGFLGKEAKKVRDRLRTDHEQIFLLVDQVNEFTNGTVSTIVINPDDLQECLIGCLLAKIMHSFNSAVILAQYGLESDCNTILRSLLETLFIFQGVYYDKNLAVQYILSEKPDQLRYANVILSDKNISKFFNKKQIANIKKNKKSLEKELASKGIKSLSTEEWSKKAKLHSVYQTAYRILSKDVHAGPFSLERFLNLDDNKKLKSIKLGPSTTDINRNLCMAAGIMLGVVEIMCELKKINKTRKIKMFKKKLKALEGKG